MLRFGESAWRAWFGESCINANSLGFAIHLVVLAFLLESRGDGGAMEKKGQGLPCRLFLCECISIPAPSFLFLILLFFKQESDTQFLLKIRLGCWLLCAVFFARRDSAEQTSGAPLGRCSELSSIFVVLFSTNFLVCVVSSNCKKARFDRWGYDL